MRCLERFPLGGTGAGGGESVQRTRISESLSAVSLSPDAGEGGADGGQGGQGGKWRRGGGGRKQRRQSQKEGARRFRPLAQGEARLQNGATEGATGGGRKKEIRRRRRQQRHVNAQSPLEPLGCDNHFNRFWVLRDSSSLPLIDHSCPSSRGDLQEESGAESGSETDGETAEAAAEEDEEKEKGKEEESASVAGVRSSKRSRPSKKAVQQMIQRAEGRAGKRAKDGTTGDGEEEGGDGGSDAGTVTGTAGSAGSVGSVMDQRERMVWMDGAPMRRLLVEGSDGRWYVSLSLCSTLFIYLV